jgi:drug/metabolite transporter (DMT)-like permease
MIRRASPIAPSDPLGRGMLCLLAAIFAFAAANALVKWSVARYPVGEVIAFRCWFALIPCACFVGAGGGIKVFRTNRLGEHLTRAIAQFLSMSAIFLAFGMMPLADAVAITFSSPIFLTVLSIPLLGERVGVHRWSAVALGFVGTLIMVRPGSGMFGLGACLALANAAIGAWVTIAIRRMSRTEGHATLLGYQLALAALFSLALLPLGWTTPSWRDAAIMALIGLASGVAQYWWTRAFTSIPVSSGAPLTYTAMLWATLFGFLLWGDVPDAVLLLGSALVMVSGCYILYRETRLRPARAADPTGRPLTTRP